MVWDDIAELRLRRVLSVLCFLDRGFVAWTVAYDVQIWKLHRSLAMRGLECVRKVGNWFPEDVVGKHWKFHLVWLDSLNHR